MCKSQDFLNWSVLQKYLVATTRQGDQLGYLYFSNMKDKQSKLFDMILNFELFLRSFTLINQSKSY